MRRIRRPRPLKHTFSNWTDKLPGAPAFVIGNGCSINDSDLSLLSNYLTIGINRAYKVIDPTILMWQDAALFNEDPDTVKSLQAIKYCRDNIDTHRQFYNFHLKPGAYRFEKQTQLLFGSGSTGPLACELAYGLGCSAIVIIGLDGKLGPKGQSDFYGNNPHWNAMTLKSCRIGLESLHRCCPIPIISCSSNDLWDRVSLPDAIAQIDPDGIHAVGREAYASSLLS